LCGYLAVHLGTHSAPAEAESALGFLRELQDAQAERQSRACRGPFLAELEHEYLRAQQAAPAEASAETARIASLITAYFVRFGAKPCCFDDVKKYAELVVGEGSRRDLVAGMRASLSQSVADWVAEDRSSEAGAWKYVSLCRLALMLGVADALQLSAIPAVDGALEPEPEPEPEPESVPTTTAAKSAGKLAAASWAADAGEAAAARMARVSKLSTTSDANADIAGLTMLYYHSLETLPGDMEDTELRVSDRVLVLIVSLLYERYADSGELHFLAQVRVKQARRGRIPFVN